MLHLAEETKVFYFSFLHVILHKQFSIWKNNLYVKDLNAGNDHMVIPEVYKCLART